MLKIPYLSRNHIPSQWQIHDYASFFFSNNKPETYNIFALGGSTLGTPRTMLQHPMAIYIGYICQVKGELKLNLINWIPHLQKFGFKEWPIIIGNKNQSDGRPVICLPIPIMG